MDCTAKNYFGRGTNENRVAWIDYVKVFLILLVVLGHAIQYNCVEYSHNWLYNRIYCFHMAAFVFVSGLLAARGGASILKLPVRLFALVLPYFFWDLFYRAFPFSPYPINLWYLWSLAIYIAFYHLVVLVSFGHDRFFDGAIVVCTLVAAGLCMIFKVSLLGARPMLLPFFVLGVICGRHWRSFDSVLMSKVLKYGALFGALIGLIGYVDAETISFGCFSYGGKGVVVYRLAIAILTIIAICSVARQHCGSGCLFMRLSALVKSLASLTLGIYAMHYAVIFALCSIQNRLAIPIGLQFVFAVVISYFLSVQLHSIPVLSLVLIGRKSLRRPEK